MIHSTWFKSILLAVFMLVMSSSFAVRFQVANDGPVTGYFAGATAEYSSFMNAKFDTSTLPGSPMDNPFDNPYVSNHVAIGTNYFWGNYDAGTQVIFNMRVMDTSEWFYSQKEFNSDGLEHLYYQAFTDSNGVPSLYVGWEDIKGLGDKDFNDGSIIFQNVMVDPTSIPAIPEPETYMMMLLGLGLIGFTLRKRFNGGGGGFISGYGDTLPTKSAGDGCVSA